MADFGQHVIAKYELYLEGFPEECIGKVDRVDVFLETDAESVAISLRDAVHSRRRARDLAHCSAANLSIFPESSPDVELTDEDVLRFLLEGAPERLRVVAPAPLRASAFAGYHHASFSQPMAAGGQQQQQQAARGRVSTSSQRSSEPTTPSHSMGRRESSSSAKQKSEPMVVFVKTGGQTLPIEVESGATVDEVKARVREQEHIPEEQQRLVFAGNEMANGHTLAHYNVHQGSEIQLMLTLASSA